MKENRINSDISDHAPKAVLPRGQCAAIDSRKISERTCKLYDYQAGWYNDRLCHFAYVRSQEGEVVGCHIRYVDPKGFAWKGVSKGTQLFGQHTGKAGTLIITEGELDCMSVYECLGNSELRNSVVVSVNSGTGSVKKQIENNISYILGFERVILFFDDDEPGRKAAKDAAAIIGPKARLINGFPYNDANEAWMEGDSAAIKLAISKAHPTKPEGVVYASDLNEKVMNPDKSFGLPYPWGSWNSCTRGMRPGEVHLIAAGTGVGKSLFARSICYHLCKQDIKCCFIGLEEAVDVTYERMLSEAMMRPFYLLGKEARENCKDDMIAASKTFAHNLLLLDRFGMDDLKSFMATVKHFVLNEECKVVFLDHFSLLADGIDLRADQRRAIDKAIAELKTLAMELQFCFVIVSHLSRDTGMGKPFEEGGEPHLSHLRGSASLGQIPSYIWMLQRNPMDNKEETHDPNLTLCHLKKNRETGEVGLMSSITFDQKQYTLRESLHQ